MKLMLFLLTSLVAAVSFAVSIGDPKSHAGVVDCPRWISVMPLREGLEEMLAKDAADQVNTTFIDGIVWLCSVNPEGNPVSDRAGCFAKLYRKTAPILRRLSPVKQGVLLQSTMGHGGFPGLATPWQLYVKANGTSNYRMCPLDERFLSYIVAACRTLAAEKPDFFMVDDDTRMISDGVPGCFCPLHLAEFEKRTGREWTREDVVAMLETGDSEDARTWDAVKTDSLKRLFRTIRSCFGDDIPGMLCVVAARPHLAHAREFAQILAASGQTPVIRGGGAPYHHSDRSDAFHVVEMISHYAAQRAVVGNDVVYMQESDTCPHTLWATSAVRTFDHLVMLALNGCKGAKIWITRTGNCYERKSAEYYRRIFRENKGMMEWVANEDIALRGVVVPCCGPKEFNFGDRYLGLTGIPYRFGEAGKGEVTALTVETLALLTHDDIRKMLSGLAVIDGPAAIWLTENGFANYIGVDAKPWNRRTIQVHEFDDGTRQNGMRTDGLADLTSTAKGARVLTRLLNRPNVCAQPEYEAPGSVLFENAEGGRVLTIAQPIPERMPGYYKAAFFSEGYRDAMVRWLSILSGGLPGGVCYLGVGPVTCEAGTTANGERIVVLNALDLDGDDSPELMIERVPSVVERLQGNGKWSVVRFEKTKSGSFRLFSPILTQRPAIFRFRDL